MDMTILRTQVATSVYNVGPSFENIATYIQTGYADEIPIMKAAHEIAQRYYNMGVTDAAMEVQEHPKLYDNIMELMQ